MTRATSFLVLVMMIGHAPDGDGSAIASGRNWRISIDSIECEAAASLIMIGTRIHYRGPSGPVEAPVSQLIDSKGKQHFPKSLVWRSGSKQLAELLSSGGLRSIQSENVAEIQLKFEVRGATGDLNLEFGDIRAFSLNQKRASATKGVCESLLQPDQIQATRKSRPPRVEDSKLSIRIYRNAYPCLAPPRARGALRTTEAEYPPYVARQLLLFGRGYLPNARQVELPMGSAAAQSYSYVGPDDLNAVEGAARRAVMADFPEYRTGLITLPADGNSPVKKYFAFNWGPQQARSGNELYSIGIYDVRPCPK